MLMQSKKHSLIEASINVLIGYLLSLAVQILIMPLYGVQLAVHQSAEIVGAFTVVSWLRSYLLRRLFNRLSILGR